MTIQPQATPAAEHLLKTRNATEVEYLCKEHVQEIHRAIAQLLFLSARMRRDIQTVVAILTTRVKKPDVDDWGEHVCVLKYLKGTKHMKLTLSIDNINMSRWWMDTSGDFTL